MFLLLLITTSLHVCVLNSDLTDTEGEGIFAERAGFIIGTSLIEKVCPFIALEKHKRLLLERTESLLKLAQSS